MTNKYNKFVAAAATVTLVASAIVPVASANETVKFNDVKDSSEYAPFIYDLAGKNVMTGSNGNFNPTTEVSRKAAVKTLGKWLVNVHGYEVPADYNTVQRFNDLKVDAKDQELVKYAALLKDSGVFTGSNGNLNADSTLNREQMAKVVVEAYSVVEGVKIVDLVADFETSLTDISKVSAGNVDYVKVFEKYGITTVDTFNPKGKIQRQHFAKFLSIAINSEKLAADTAALTDADTPELEDAVTPALKAVETAVAALPKVEAVTIETAQEATKAVEAVTAAVASATKVIATAELSADAKAAAEKVLADATTAAKLVADKVAEVSKLVEVASVKGINATSFEIALPKGFTAKEADLVGKQITVTAGTTKLVATYSEKSLDKEGKAIFTLATGAKFEDAVKYTATANWAKFTADTFVAKTADVYVASFEKVTTAVGATKDGDTLVNVNKDEKPEANIQVAAKDQYGDAITLKDANVTIEGTLNGMPLSSTELSIKDGVVTVTSELKVDDVLAFTLTAKDSKGKEIAKNAFSYTIVKAEASKIAKIELAAKDNKVELNDGSDIEVSAKAFNQFNSNVDVTTDNIVWFVNGKATTANDGVLTLKKQTAGEYKIQAFSKADSKVKAEIVVTIAAPELSKLVITKNALEDIEGNPATLKDVVATDKGFNKEEVVLGTIAPEKGAKLSAADIKFNIETADKTLTKEDITVKAEEVKTEAGKTVILVKATTAKAGTFKVTPFVGTEFTADKVAKGDAFEVTTDVNTEVASIAIGSIAAKELKAGSKPRVEVTIKNKHGEVLNAAQAANVKVYSSNADVATGTIVAGSKDIKGEDVNKTYLQLDGSDATGLTEGLTEGAAVVTLQAGKVVDTLKVDVVTPVLNTITVKDAKVSGVVAGDNVAKYNEISFLDQDGVKTTVANDIVVTDAAGTKVETGLAVELGKVTVNEKTGGVKFDKGADNTHLQVKAAAGLKQGTYTVTVSSVVKETGKEDRTVKTSFQVVVDAERATSTAAISAVESKVVKGGSATILVTPKDQYGEVMQSIGSEVKVTLNDSTDAIALTAVTAKDLDAKLEGDAAKKVVYYKATVSTLKDGENKFKVAVTDKDAKVINSASTTVTVDTVANLVDSVSIKEVKGAQNLSGTNVVALDAVIRDADKNEVSVKADELTWTVEGVKDAKGNDLTVTPKKDADGKVVAYTVVVKEAKGTDPEKTVEVSVINGKLSLDGANLGELFIDVTVAVGTTNFKTASTTVTVGDAVAAYKSGFAVANMYEGTEVKAENEIKATGTNLVIDNETKAVTLTFTGVDQYGVDFDIADLNAATVATSGNVTAKVSSDNKSLVITADTVDATEVYLTYKGEKVTFKVSVDGKAKEALKK